MIAKLSMLLLLLVGACTAHPGGHCSNGFVCDGAGALVCIDHKWVGQRCKEACTMGKHSAKCDLVDDPQVGESCYYTGLEEGHLGNTHQLVCSPDGKSVLDCRPPDGLWTATACAAGKCTHGHCIAEPQPDKTPVIGQPYFEGGVQVEICEAGSPPLTLEKDVSRHACWYAGTSCEGHGTLIGKPFALAGNIVSGMTVHGGCNLTQFALIYEKGTSPLKLRVCGVQPPPVDCPAMANDGARWDVTKLLDANHATKAVLLAH